MSDHVCGCCLRLNLQLTTDPLSDYHSYVCQPCYDSRQMTCVVCGLGWCDGQSYNCDVCRVRFHVHCDPPTEELVVIDENWGEAYTLWKCERCCC